MSVRILVADDQGGPERHLLPMSRAASAATIVHVG